MFDNNQDFVGFWERECEKKLEAASENMEKVKTLHTHAHTKR